MTTPAPPRRVRRLRPLVAAGVLLWWLAGAGLLTAAGLTFARRGAQLPVYVLAVVWVAILGGVLTWLLGRPRDGRAAPGWAYRPGRCSVRESG
jgi:hypothetical protein